MTALSEYEHEVDAELWRKERTPTAWVLGPLFLVIAALVALVVIPPLISSRNAALRGDLTSIYSPLNTRVSALERSIGAELAAARGFALTGDPFFVDRFLAVHEYGNAVAAEVDSLSAMLGGPIAEAADQLRETRDFWAAANFGQSRVTFREGMDEHQQHFEAVMSASSRLRDLTTAASQSHLQRIASGEQLRDRVTALLAILALFGAGGALWLAQRVRRSGRHLLRRVREEAALRQIAQTMAEAEDLQGALARIVGAVAQVAGADRAYIEQVDIGRGEVEVIAAIGAGAPEVGSRTPLVDSATERVLASGETGRAWASSLNTGETDESRADREKEGMRYLVVPLVSEGEQLGTLSLDRPPPKRPFDQAEARRSRLLADMAAVVLRRLRLYEESRQQEVRLKASAEELRALNETLEERVRARTSEVRELSRALTLTEQRERREIAQVLHDDLQQVLFALQLNLNALELRVGKLPETTLRSELSHAQEVVTEAIGATRRLTVDLSPPVNKDSNFGDTLKWLANHTHERFGLDVEVRYDEQLSITEDDMRLVLFQIVRELLFNVVKHAGAERAIISVRRNDGTLTVEVQDDGEGFEPDESGESGGSTIGGFGLRRASERLALFGGEISVSSEPGRGTSARVDVPVDLLAAG